MADPEQIYQEVLQEEQGKGSSGPVAEGRAKSARARAEAGSPHPKEPKWWAGAQPHLEGGDAEAGADEAAEAEPEPEAEPAEEPAAEAPAEEQPAAEAPEPAAEAAPAPTAPAETEPAPAAAAPGASDQEAGRGAATAAPAAAAGAVAAPAAVATEPEHRQVTGVTHGTPTGNRLRPEDGVASEAQFEGQRAMYERRKLIDELVATGVPAATAATTGRQRAPWLAILYLIIPLLVVGFIVTNSEDGETAAEPAPQETGSGGGEGGGGGGGGGGTVALVAQGLAFDTETIEVTAGEPTPAELTNEDTAVHNLVIFDNPDEASGEELFTSPDVDAGSSETFEIDPLDEGEYFFYCAYHPQMEGTVTSS